MTNLSWVYVAYRYVTNRIGKSFKQVYNTYTDDDSLKFESTADMESIRNKLPDWQTEIQQLYQEDEDFQEMCADYEEINSLLCNWNDPAKADSATINEYTSLLKKIEAEIMEVLQTRHQIVEYAEQEAASPPDRHSENGAFEGK